MKKLKGILLAGAILMLATPVYAWGASSGSNATGAKLPKFENAVTRTVDTSDSNKFSTSLRNYLAEAAAKASSQTPYKIIIPPGTYTARYWQNVPSYTWIYAKGATIHALKGKKNLVFLSNKSLQNTQNTKIEGGTWDTTTQAATDSPVTAPFRFAHVKNLVFQDMTITCNRAEHIIELADINGLTIKNCKISGNTLNLGNVQPKEAIQLDVATQSAMVNMTPYNGKGCHNVIIQNNQFTNVSRGVGSHNEKEKSVESNPYTNVTVRGNSFKNLKAEAVFVTWWKSCTIDKNTVENGKRAGICLDRSSKVKVTNNTIKKITSFTGARKKEYGSTAAGILLWNSSNNSIQKNTASQCKNGVVKKQGTCKGNTITGNKNK